MEFTEFTDYSQPNKATADGEVDLNAFQHYNFLNNWNKENGKDLVAIADTYISPIRLYSGKNGEENKYTKVEEIPNNGELQFQTMLLTKAVPFTFFNQQV